MAYKIVVSQCTACGACEFECPTGAIATKRGNYVINAATCTECEGHFPAPKCNSVCPVPETCIPA